MADNQKGIPFNSADEGFNFPRVARELVLEQARALVGDKEHGSAIKALTANDVYVVWFAYILGNFKALCSTPIADGRYYEVTFDRGKKIAFVDTYVKTHNNEINIDI